MRDGVSVFVTQSKFENYRKSTKKEGGTGNGIY